MSFSSHNDPPPRDESISLKTDFAGPTHLSSQTVIVFARFPEPGKVKTRLIPALGSEGAAQLQQALTQATLTMVHQYCLGNPCELEVQFAGGDEVRMRNLFGDEHHYMQQQGSNLGERLEHAIAVSFEQGSKRVVVIGTDCPEVEPSILQAAFDSLLVVDVVLGPALDGGYYLIGLRANRPELFREIEWSTENVLRQTLENANRLRCSVRQLKPLSDVDYPDDLNLCRRALEALPAALPESLVRWYSSNSNAIPSDNATFDAPKETHDR